MSNIPDKKSSDHDNDMHRVVSIAMGMSADEARLAQLGHVQELERRFSLFSLGAMCLCLMATWEALSTVIAPALIGGGAPCLFYN
jgi:choline transport protein